MYGFKLNNGFKKGGASGPVPSAGSFVPLSWEGANTAEYIFSVDKDTPCNYNTIIRDGAPTDFNLNMFSKETMSSDTDFVISGDVPQDANTNFMVGFGLKSDTGVGFADLDYAVWPNGTNINWIISGNDGIKTTITASELFSYRLEYFAATDTVDLYINNTFVLTETTAYSSDTLCVKIQGRNPGTVICNHLALKTVAQPDKMLYPIGDSFMFGRALSSGVAGNSHVFPSIAFTNHNLYANPVFAVSGAETIDVINDQIPLLAANYDAGRIANEASVQIGINDVMNSVPLVTIKANIITIVSSIQAIGINVNLSTIIPDLGTVWPDTDLLNTWILAGTPGQDKTIDYTTSSFLLTLASREADELHPNPAGMNAMSEIEWLTLKDL